MSTPPEDVAMEVGLARQTEKLTALEKTMGREFTHLGAALAQINAFILELKSELVSKAEHNALDTRVSRIEKIVYTMIGVVLLAVLAAVLANIGLKK